jgi:hypothetical protein
VFQAALFFAACLACTKTSDPVDVFRRDFPSVARQLLAGLPSAAALDENPKDRPSASELERALLAG